MDAAPAQRGPRDWRPTDSHWGIIAKLIHWLMAVMIIGMLIVGTIMENMEFSDLKFELYQLHKSFGLTLMVLALIRLLWRVPGAVPALPATMPGWQRRASSVSHILLYGFMFAMPLSGWVMVSASDLGIQTSYFGLFDVPHLVEPDEDLEETMKRVHGLLAWGLVALLAVHLCAALKHHLVDRDAVLRRMLPGRTTM
ncbi:MAG: cytochrome b [Alphaproteobacteria bacterium]